MSDYTIRPFGAAISAEFDLDSGASGGPYHIDLAETEWGVAKQPDPDEEASAEGTAIFLPLEQSWERRTIRLRGAVECTGLYDKSYKRATLTRLFSGRQTLRRFGWEIDVVGAAPVEADDSRRTPQLLVFDVTLTAQPPFWRHVVALKDIAYGAYLYPDFGVPYGEVQPPWLFGRDLAGAQAIAASPAAGLAHFTLNNWGTAYCYPTAAITGGPPSTDLYLKGLGRFRVKVTTDGAGAATLATTQRFYLEVGDNPIRLENLAGTAINLTGYGTMRIDFGATRLREL